MDKKHKTKSKDCLQEGAV